MKNILTYLVLGAFSIGLSGCAEIEAESPEPRSSSVTTTRRSESYVAPAPVTTTRRSSTVVY